MSRLVPIALLAVLVLVATACGSEANSYRKQVDTAQKAYRPKLAPLETDLSTAIADRRTADAARTASQAAVVMAQLAARVQKIKAPSSLEARSEKLVAAYGELVLSLQQMTSALKAHAPAKLNGAISRFNDARLDESSAVAALNGT
jgi:cytochrome c-type biogenesis protein CcmH/NrfG